MIKRLFFMFSIFLSYDFYAQTNYVYNPDFESLDQGSATNEQGAVNDLQSWECRTKKIDYGASGAPNYQYLHSPDLYTANYSPAASFTGLNFSVTSPTPHSGSGMVGMLPYELIEQQFNNQAMNPGEMYTLSMYIWLADDNPSWWQNHKLNMFLAKNKIEYKKENREICSDDYTTYDLSFNQRYAVGEKTLNLTIFPTGQWHRVSFTFKAPSDIKTAWDWLVIDVTKPDYSSTCGQNDPCGDCSDAYLFIDDVTITQADYCNAFCSPPKFLQGYFNFTIHDEHVAFDDRISASCYPWWFTVENAIGIDFEVFNSWGQLIYEQHAFDVNILKDVGYTDYFFGWLGQLPSGNNLTVGSFPYKLHIWNCYHDFYRNSNLVNAGGNCTGNVQGYDIVNGELNDCCPQVIYVQNKVYGSTIIHPKVGADEFIYAGSNVTTSIPSGPVVVQAGTTVKYVAGINVVLENGFSALPGSNFTAEVEPCAYSQRMGIVDRRSMFSLIKNDNLDLDTKQKVLLYPNPTSGILSFTTTQDASLPKLVAITDMRGTEIMKIEVKENKLDLSILPNGIYFVCFMNSDKFMERKKIVIIK